MRFARGDMRCFAQKQPQNFVAERHRALFENSLPVYRLSWYQVIDPRLQNPKIALDVSGVLSQQRRWTSRAKLIQDCRHHQFPECPLCANSGRSSQVGF